MSIDLIVQLYFLKLQYHANYYYYVKNDTKISTQIQG